MENKIEYSNTDIRALIPPIPKQDKQPKSEVFKEIITSNYKSIFDTELTDLELITEEILQLKINMIDNTILLGIKLLQAKETLGRGNWLPWLEEKVDFTARTAQKFMKIATEYRNTRTYSYLGSDKLYKLLDLPSIEREQFISDNNVGEMSCRELTKTIKEIKDDKKAIKKAQKEAKVIDVEVIEVVASDHVEDIVNVKEYIEITKVDTEAILKKIDSLIEEITIRTGRFYTETSWNDDIECDNRGGIIAQLYATEVITQEELLETVKAHNIDLVINFKEIADGTLKDKYANNISNSYRHYYDNENYIDVVESKELSYENTTDFSSWCDGTSTLDFIKCYKFEKCGLTMLSAYDDNGDSNLCVYDDKKLIGHYCLGDKWNPLEEDKELLDNIDKLAKLDNIELENLYTKWLKQYTTYYKREKKRNIAEDNEHKRRQKYEGQKNNFNLKYSGKTTYVFEDIYDLNGTIKYWDKYRDNNKEYMDYLKKETEDFSNKYKKYGGYDFGGMLGTTSIKDEEKPLYKKFYKTLAMAYHPDKVQGDGAEMKVINQLKQSWGI